MLTGKGMFVWRIQDCHNGSVSEITQKAVNAGYSHVLIKIANGIYSYNFDWDKKIDLVPPLVQALKRQGIQVWGWHYLFGDQPGQEAQKAISRIRQLGVDGYVIDAEGHYKGKYNSAKTFMSQLRAEINDIPVALSSYRYPSYHSTLPWNEFLKKCDLNMPQVYWMQAHNPGAQLRMCVAQFQNLTYKPPIFPTGAAFTEWGWTPKPLEVKEFMDTAKAMKMKGVNFWEWKSLYHDLPAEIMRLIRDYDWGKKPQPPQDVAELYIQALNSHQADNVKALYKDQAVHITSERTVQGTNLIKSWYTTMFNELLPNATFNLAGFTGTGNIRHINWTASSSSGNVQNGSDTIGLIDNKIAYHFTEFAVI